MNKTTERVVITIMYLVAISFGWTLGTTIAELIKRFL